MALASTVGQITVLALFVAMTTTMIGMVIGRGILWALEQWSR